MSDLFVLGTATVVPDDRVGVDEVRRDEGERWERQLGALSPSVRRRVESGLGITSVRTMAAPPSEAGRAAAARALDAAGIEPTAVDAVIDFSTLPGDHPGVWSLAHKLQAELGCHDALPMSVNGSGCAGFFVALRVAGALLATESPQGAALLVASDRVAAKGRCSLPISIMGDAASAVVVSLQPPAHHACARVTGLCTTTLGVHHDIVVLQGSPPLIEVDTAAFEAKILPLHFLMCHRVLGRALSQARRQLEELSALAYPNTTQLDRESVARALDLAPSMLTGSGLTTQGHAFASDLIINLPRFWDGWDGDCAAVLGVGSGFTWGACILERRLPQEASAAPRPRS